jgi:hypothetical protein
MPSKQMSSYAADIKYAFQSAQQAEKAAMQIGCVGSHAAKSGEYFPCKSRTTFLKTLGIPQQEELVLKESNQETVDYAVLRWVDETLNIHSETNSGFKKVPVVWLTSERAHQIKVNRELRQPDSDALVFPLISIKRDTMEKADAGKRPIPGNVFRKKQAGVDHEMNQFYIGKKMNQDKTRNFARAASLRLNSPDANFPVPKNQRIVYKRYYVPLPIYYNFNYSINLRADYQTQLNQMLQLFAVYSNNINTFMIYSRNHRYEAFFDGITLEDNIAALAEEEKKYEAIVKLRVLGYITGRGVNDNIGDHSVVENQVKIRFPREQVIIGNLNEAADDGFFKD